MYRILAVVLFCVGLFCLGQAPRAQLTMTGVGGGFGAGGFTPSCAASTNWLARATGVTLSADKTNYDNLLCGLNTDGVLTKLDGLYVFTTVNAATYKLNLISSSFPLTEHGTFTFTQYAGLQGNGTTGYEDTGFIASSGGTNFVQNSASMGVCVLTSSAADHGKQMGTSNAINDYIWVLGGTGEFIYAINGGVPGTPATANTQGLWIANRSSSASIQAYKNGSLIDTTASTSGGLDNVSTIIFARNNNPPGDFDDMQYGAAFFGSSLSATDASNFHARLNTYLTAYSQGGKC